MILTWCRILILFINLFIFLKTLNDSLNRTKGLKMPKTLSLKKTSQNGATKNQKAITQFFKNTNPSNSAELQKSELNAPKCIDKTSPDKCGIKRKAFSPSPQKKTKDLAHNHILHTKQNLSNTTNKKIKTSNISPSQANSSSSMVFPSLKENTKLNQNSTSPVKSAECLVKEKERSPLTSVDINNKIEDLIECHIDLVQNVVTPKKVCRSPTKLNKTPRKSPLAALCKTISRTPDKVYPPEFSPSKRGSTAKILQFSQDEVNDMFGDDWDLGLELEEINKEDLDLSSMQRCEIINLSRHPSRLELKLKNADNLQCTLFIEGIWIETPLSQGDFISVIASRDSSGSFRVGNTNGLLVLRPDHLMSSTSVVAGVFCKRKAILQERWKGIDSANNAMTMGILIHELVQKALTSKIFDISNLKAEAYKILKESTQMLYDAGLSEEEAKTNMQVYIPPLADFMQSYMSKKTGNVSSKAQKDKWQGHIDEVLDIEENICCPQLGLKGKIDATLQVTIHEKTGRQKALVPLELKSGRASMSAEHRGQLVMYGMMLSLQRQEDPTTSTQRGLLLYLKEKVELREVSCGYPERRDLVMLRNQLVQYLAASPEQVDPEQIADIEDASALLQQNLPEPVDHERACSNCPYLSICSLHLWHTDGPSVPPTHPLSKLQGQALGHLSPEHIKFFLHWTALLKMEEKVQMKSAPLHALWTDTSEKRSKRGTCANNLQLKSVKPSGDRHVHIFQRHHNNSDKSDGTSNAKGPQEGEFSIVSIEGRPWIAAGVINIANEKKIHILLERDLSRRLDPKTLYNIDTYESYATTVQNLTNLGVLIEDSDRAERLRRLIIDKDEPKFEKKLPREVGRLGAKLMKSLNIEQQRAVLRAVMAQDYALLQGLPGTGKTQTISVLIQMLVALKQRVLVTAHTHSAVDTVLCRLPTSLKVMRLGSSSRVAASLSSRCEQKLAMNCTSVQELTELYDSMEVVGVTCLGAAHAMLSRTTFDVCIVDEATQVLQTTVLRPLFATKKFVLVGDPEQLPPVVRSRAARRLGMEESLFHRLMSEDVTSTLQLQYRMNQPLADLANKVAYNGKLKCADPNVASAKINVNVEKLTSHYSQDWILKACSPDDVDAAIFLDTLEDKIETDSKSCTNVSEACIVMALVEALTKGGVKAVDIGIIAPYRDQVALLRRCLLSTSVDVSTVDQFQGRDKSVIIYSCTKKERGEKKTEVRDGEVLNDQRRLAVSVTRAKHKLILVGNSSALRPYQPFRKLLEECSKINLDSKEIKCVSDQFEARVC